MTTVASRAAAPRVAGRRAHQVEPAPSLSILLGLEGLALGGCPINALDLGRTLRARGHQVEVFAVDEQVRTSLLPYAAHCGFNPVLIPTDAGTLARARQIRRLMRDTSADVVHVFAPWLGRAATIAAAGHRRRTAVVTNWMMENVSYVPRATPLVLGTRALQVEAEQIQQRPVWLMEPPVDLEADAPDAASGAEFRRALGIADHEVVAVVVGRVDTHLKEEGLLHAIQAVQILDRPDLRLVVVGDGDAFDRVRAAAVQANARLGRTAVLTPGAMQDPRPAYDAADIALGMGGSALRCLAHARPLIVLGTGGFARVYDASSRQLFARQGFFGHDSITGGDEHLAHQIESLLDPDRRRELGAFGHASVQSYGLSAGADTLEQMYRVELGQLAGPATRTLRAGMLAARGVAHETRAQVQGWRHAGPARQP